MEETKMDLILRASRARCRSERHAEAVEESKARNGRMKLGDMQGTFWQQAGRSIDWTVAFLGLHASLAADETNVLGRTPFSQIGRAHV